MFRKAFTTNIRFNIIILFGRDFIKKSLNPVRFVSGNNGDHEAILAEINKPLLLMGLEVTKFSK